MKRTLFPPEHETCRDTVRGVVDAELVLHHPEWEKEQRVPREAWSV